MDKFKVFKLFTTLSLSLYKFLSLFSMKKLFSDKNSIHFKK